MKPVLFLFLFIGVEYSTFANHTKGGWIYYRYAGAGGSSNTAKYVITLKVYTECVLTANQWCASVNVSIFQAGDNSLYANVEVPNSRVTDIQNCTRQECHECINDIPNICYKIATFEFIMDLPITPDGYIVAYQRCCRVANILNLAAGSSTVGDTWVVNIPGTDNPDPKAYQNSSALFAQNDTAIICRGNNFKFDFSAIDPDGDSLSYSFADAYYASRGNGAQCNTQADTPPFTFVSYVPPYSGNQPLGSAVTIDNVTGIVSGVAPPVAGTYVLTCMVKEYMRGTNIVKSYVRKSLHIYVADCSLTQALLEPEYYNCDGFIKSFKNLAAGGNIHSYSWDFGVPGAAGDTSNLEAPTFTFPDTGTYRIKLVVNKSLPCSDSAFALVKVYPVFAPGFFVRGQCKNTPIRFIDTTTTTYGYVNSWEWDFGDGVSENNTSLLHVPNHSYGTEDSYRVSLKVSNDKGCRGTVNKMVLVTDKPALQLTNDTLICTIDTLQLQAEGFGSVTWSPAYNIDSPTSFSPLVSPDVPTTYYARLVDPYGCSGTDSVFVDVKSFVTLRAGTDTTVCQTDAFVLPLLGDALHYSWSAEPGPGGLNDASAKNPLATPLVSTVFTVRGSIGNCFAEDRLMVRVVPYPNASGGADTAICLGTSVRLHASGGSFYSWSPAAFLDNAFIADPVSSKPLNSISYKVTVTDTLGCPKPASGSVLVDVLKVNANAGPADTVVVLDQPLLLNATGGSHYQWEPPLWLSNPTVPNPTAMPLNDIKYVVKVSNGQGCYSLDSIRVRVYQLAAGIYVPTAFTPNSDGRNDYFRPLALGLKSLDVFRIYNRWGELLYSDTNIESQGWDGTYKGNKQEPATYVWYAEGINYRNERSKKRGYVVLIR
jgi:gliding motility-associated-like protein